jgi:RNA polymerase sigma factor (sigma-70 family)
MSWHGIHALIERAKAGDDDAWQSLHEMVRPHLLSVGKSLPGPALPDESVSDLTQITWMSVLKGIDGFRSGIGDIDTEPLFRAWLSKIMKNVKLNRQRDARAQRRRAPLGMVSLSAIGPGDSADSQGGFEPIADDSTPSTKVRRDDQKELIQRVLDQLKDPTDRELVLHHFFENRSLRQIAKERGWSDYDLGKRMDGILNLIGRHLKELR